MLPLWIIDLHRDEVFQEKIREKIEALPGAEENWRYTRYSDINFEDENWFVDFVQELVSTGQKAIRDLKTVRPINDCCMNVCVLGDATEEYTLKFFSSTAAIVKREKGRIIPGHIHQGINILGMLYVPSDIHNSDFNKRQSVLRCLKELDVQHKVNLAAGYDRIMLYQDTQRRTAKFYPLLDYEQRLDYLFQCLVHLYFACDTTHPLIDSNGSGEDFFFSMGVGSLYYDTNEQDEKDLIMVGNRIFSTIKEKGTADALDHEVNLYDVRLLSAEHLFDILQINFEDIPSISSLKIRKPSPHPINDFKDKGLIRYFYKNYLKRYPSNVLKEIISKMSESTTDSLEMINVRMQDYYDQTEEQLRKNCRNIIRNEISPEVGCLSLLTSKLAKLRETVSRLRPDVRDEAESELWKKIETQKVPSRLHDAFLEYHNSFMQDEENTQASACDEKKAQVMEELTGILSWESTLLSSIGRSFLAGIVLVFAIMPVLETLSPNIINIGNIRNWSFLWAAIIFLIPFIVKYVKLLKYYHKIKFLCNKLIAFYLHDKYARLINRAKNQIYDFYRKFTNLCEEYEKRCELIIEEPSMLSEVQAYTLELPKTMFNQPVIDGNCCGIRLFPDSEMNKNLLNVRGNVVRVDKVSKKQSYAIVQDFSDLFMTLFEDVRVYDRLYRDKETHELIYKTDTELAKDTADRWQETKDKFHLEFVTNIKTILVPRSDVTVSQKLSLLASRPENQKGFKVFSEFCESSGEFTANDDKEFADIKTNSMAVQNAFAKYLPVFTTVCQVNTDDMYRSYVFLTKWKSFDNISANRILPETELFDKDIFDTWGKPPKSSLILYALLGNMSSEWYTLFSPVALLKVPEACKEYKDELERRK